MVNEKIEMLLKKEKICKWQVAKKIGIHETTFSRWFRDELSKEQLQEILSAVEEIRLDRLKIKK